MKTPGRIAICISGEIRTAIEALPAFTRFFGVGHDLFVHCWNDDKDTASRLKKIYRPTRMVAEMQDPIHHHLPFSSMLYSMMMANELKRQSEIEMGYRYDLVVRTRFDVIFGPNLVLPRKKPEPRMISCLGLTDGFNNIDYNNKGIDDVTFWGDSIAMDIACETYLHFTRNCRKTMESLQLGNQHDPGDCFFSPGVLIYQTSIKRNVMFEFLQGFNFALFRTSAGHLHPIRDFEKIKEIYYEGGAR